MVVEGRLGDVGTLCKLIDRDLVDRLFLGDQLDKGSADPFFRSFGISVLFHLFTFLTVLIRKANILPTAEFSRFLFYPTAL